MPTSWPSLPTRASSRWFPRSPGYRDNLGNTSRTRSPLTLTSSGALLEAGAHVFVCGNANTIAPAVRAALIDIQRQRTGASSAESDAWLANLKAEKRYVEDIWGG
jgi:hypothetical protein